jgi:hypothetical protein
MGKIRGSVILLPLLLIASLALPKESADYLGWKRCAGCHAEISKSWQNSKHAKAFESLKKSGQQELPACVKCHVTGYEQTGGFIDYELTPEMADVQCEECHEAGSEHVGNPAGQGMVKTPGIETCRRCHTKGQDPGFNYDEKVKAVHSSPQ